ncbi:hypothetical protein DXV76_04730 [Rhodobacteraceae bacterium CCMM004]|nr:hypothetical protein DXV76_04730 [Rhodobacteraceae bacterium CCMM004]
MSSLTCPAVMNRSRGRPWLSQMACSLVFMPPSQFTSREWQTLLHQQNLDPSMSRSANCHDNAVGERFFRLLKRERIGRRTYPTREAARQDLFEHIELFYNPKRKHTNNGMLSPVDFEIRQQKPNQAGVWETKGTSACDGQKPRTCRTPVIRKQHVADLR